MLSDWSYMLFIVFFYVLLAWPKRTKKSRKKRNTALFFLSPWLSFCTTVSSAIELNYARYVAYSHFIKKQFISKRDVWRWKGKCFCIREHNWKIIITVSKTRGAPPTAGRVRVCLDFFFVTLFCVILDQGGNRVFSRGIDKIIKYESKFIHRWHLFSNSRIKLF